MTSADPVQGAWRVLRRLAFVMVLVLHSGLAAGADRDGPEVWLVTYGPGEIYWQRFGHNAIWIRDADLGLDHTFNFGFFDFEQEDFFLRFLQGRMLYFSAAQPATVEFAQYIDENRGIRAQRLAVDADRALQLAAFLVNEVQPQNRDYLYDYYLDNCSTRVRDALDQALGGRLREAYADVPAGLNFRQHTRRLSQPDYWLYLGLELGLGAPVDRPISRWEEFFIPGELAEGLNDMVVPGGVNTPLVVEDVVLYRSTAAPPPVRPERTWPRYLLLSIGTLLAVALLARHVTRLSAQRFARVWLVVAGTVGSAMLFFWFGTDHLVAANNLNLLLFNPLWLIGAFNRQSAGPVALLLALSAVIALVAPGLPPFQHTADALAAFLPLNLGSAWALYRASRPAKS